MTKADLRSRYHHQRQALTALEWAARCQAVADRFITWLTTETTFSSRPAIFHVFLPIKQRKEVDTWLIIQHLWHSLPQIRLAVPLADLEAGAMTHHELTSGIKLIQNQFGVQEPAPTTPSMPPNAFDLVLVPLLAFDRQGHRVGYGGGFYDRFLPHCRPDCLTMGLSLFEAIEQIDDIYEGDCSLNACVTPRELCWFPRGK